MEPTQPQQEPTKRAYEPPPPERPPPSRPLNQREARVAAVLVSTAVFLTVASLITLVAWPIAIIAWVVVAVAFMMRPLWRKAQNRVPPRRIIRRPD